MTAPAADPPPPTMPPLSFPVAGARFVCPNCGAPVVFQAQPAEPSTPAERPMVCACKAVLGMYVVSRGRMVWLRIAGPD